MNKVILVGNLGRDAELRIHTIGARRWRPINMATTEVWTTNQDSVRKDRVAPVILGAKPPNR